MTSDGKFKSGTNFDEISHVHYFDKEIKREYRDKQYKANFKTTNFFFR